LVLEKSGMKKSVIIIIHIAFWSVLLLTKFAVPLAHQFLSPDELGEMVLFTTFLPPLFFYLGYWVIMRIKWKVRHLLAIIGGVAAIYLGLYIRSDKLFAYALVPTSVISLYIIVGALFRFFIDWFKKKNDVLVLEKENVVSGLARLKSQVNPHFLFNTLHNIDALIYEDKDKASQSLVKLADMMRYMLTDAKADYVSLHKEINHLNDYLSLELIRLKNEEFVKFSINGDDSGYKIAPMLLIPFIENAFKHSVDSDIENGIRIKISIKNRTLCFNCENDFDASEIDKDKCHGIGLDTVKKRLQLIYKNNYNLSIRSEEQVFKVNLEINLNEN